jgi:serine/threonine protein kinase
VLNPGSTVGEPSRRYQIVRAVGRGGMGEVYEATQVQLARRVAIKTIRADLASKPELLARFRREAESAAALGHPNLVQVTDFQANPGEAAFLVMEMLDGATLAQVLAQEGRLDPSRAAFIGVQLLSGLAAAHRAGIVHRDVKPANVFLQSTSVMRDLVKVLDFGVAKLALEATPDGRAMTQAGEVLGTLSYMAPEQAVSGAAIDARTDIFGVGATLFHALSGVRPFDAIEPGGARTPLERIAPWIHRDLAAVIERALQRTPDARWSTADDMAAALQPFAAGAGPGAVGASPSSPSSPSSPGGYGGERRISGWDPAAIGRLEAPTGGGSSYGSGYPPAPGGSSFGASSGFAPTGFDPNAPPRDATLMGHGARAPAPHVALPPVIPAPPPFASASSYGPLPGAVGSSAPAGAVPLAMPPYGYGYGAPPPQQPMQMQQMQQMHGAVPRRSPPWWIVVVAVVALAVIAPYAFSFLAFRNATNPDTIATNVEREVLKQPKQPCPQLEQCNVSTEEHGLTYPTCSKKLASSSTYRPGEMILGGKDTRIGLITSEAGNHRHNVRFLTVQQEVELGDDEIIGRMCRRGGPRAGSNQTLP